MSDKDEKIFASESEDRIAKTREFAPGDFELNSISSAETIGTQQFAVAAGNAGIEKGENRLPEFAAPRKSAADKSFGKRENPIFDELDDPTLPDLARENRARLQMQSPTRLYFYWSFERNPFEALRRVFGADAAEIFTLVVKLVNQRDAREEIFPVQIEGSHWFNVDADAAYRAEIGFYAARRPFVRLLLSNRIETPRKNPSARGDDAAVWTISANDFAEVLDASGFAQDAFEVALAGDDADFADIAVKTAFAQMFGETENDFFNNNPSEMRFSLLALAAGYAPENLRGQISHSLFLHLQKNSGDFSREKALVALRENFGVFASENAETEFLSPTVFGASLINFPRSSKRRFSPKFAPLSSFLSSR